MLHTFTGDCRVFTLDDATLVVKVECYCGTFYVQESTLYYKREAVCKCYRPIGKLYQRLKKEYMEDQKTINTNFNRIFKLSSTKTLKTSLKEGVLLQDAVQHAYAYLNSPECPYTKIQFKYGSTYLILSKLKEE